MNPDRKLLTDQERRAFAELQVAAGAYLGSTGANPEQLAAAAYSQALTAFATCQVLLELVRDRGLVSPEALSRMVAEKYSAMARDLSAQPRIVVPRTSQ